MSVLVFSTILNDPELIPNESASSERTAYPHDNALNLERRKLVWRSNGYFEVTISNNIIIFRESVGVDLTATLTVGYYASDTLFFAEVKAALEVAGASTYTVSRDTTTGKIKIVSNGAGGGGIFQLITTSGSFTAEDLLGFDNASNLTGALTYQADVIRIHSSEWLLWDLGFPSSPTGFIAVADRNRALKLSPSATVKLQGNWTNNWSTPAVDLTLSVQDYLIAQIDSDGFGSYRYWRFLIEDKENSNLYVEFGAVMLGIHAAITRGCPAFPLSSPIVERSNVAYSEGGQTIVARRAPTQSFRLNWEKLDKASLEELEGVFNKFGKFSSFFIAMDPDSVFSTNGKTWCRLVKFQSDPTMTLVSPNNWSMDWDLREEL